MNLYSPWLWAPLLALAGGIIGYILRQLVASYRKDTAELSVKKLLLDAKGEAQKTFEEAKKREGQLRKLEEKILAKDESLEKRRRDLDLEVENLKKKVEEIKKIREDAESLEAKKREELQKIAGLSEDEAKKNLMDSIEKKYEGDILARIQKLEIFGQEKLEQRARDTLAAIIQRLASSTASEVSTTSVQLPSDDIKGKIIGKEGRNIRALERAAGVEIIVDDT